MEPQGAGWLCYSGRALEAAWAIGKHGGTWLLQYTSSVALSICCPPELHWMAIHCHYSSLKEDWGHRTVGLKGRLRILARRTCQHHALRSGLLTSSRPACSVLSPHLCLFILEFARCHLSCSFPAPVPRSPPLPLPSPPPFFDDPNSIHQPRAPAVHPEPLPVSQI